LENSNANTHSQSLIGSKLNKFQNVINSSNLNLTLERENNSELDPKATTGQTEEDAEEERLAERQKELHKQKILNRVINASYNNSEKRSLRREHS